jgi:S1-C subfamily serine protease
LGIDMVETGGGVVAGRVNDGLAKAAGMAAGDLVLTTQGAPVFTRADLWLVQRLLEPGARFEVTYLRGTEVRGGSAVVPAQ